MSSEILLTEGSRCCIIKSMSSDRMFGRDVWKGRIGMNKVNYQRELDKTLERLAVEGKKPSLLLHACCAPCSSYVLEYLSAYFEITLYFYNPNIAPREEYEKRLEELERLCLEMQEAGRLSLPVKILAGEYEPERFTRLAQGREELPEGEAAKVAKEGGFDYMTTTLSISPYKNAEKLNEIGRNLEKQTGVAYLYSDFKKKNGYQRSIALSQEFDLYRQDYCGCVYSRAEREHNRH